MLFIFEELKYLEITICLALVVNFISFDSYVFL